MLNAVWDAGGQVAACDAEAVEGGSVCVAEAYVEVEVSDLLVEVPVVLARGFGSYRSLPVGLCDACQDLRVFHAGRWLPIARHNESTS